jgi:hypothetical protein
MKMGYGQQLVKRFLDAFGIKEYKENYRPEWLFGMELDFYIEKRNLAIEFNGDQHYVSTTYGTPDEQIKRDLLKKRICKDRKIRLVVIHAGQLHYHWLRAYFRVSKHIVEKNEEALRKIQNDVSEYKRLLRKKYGESSPTTMNKSRKRRPIMDGYKSKRDRLRSLLAVAKEQHGR